jgi:hypothetical protein
MLAQEVEQGHPRVDHQAVLVAVDPQGDLHLVPSCSDVHFT